MSGTSEDIYLTTEQLLILHMRACDIALRDSNPKEVLYRFNDLLADQTAPKPCMRCHGTGYTGNDYIEDVCDEEGGCLGTGSIDRPRYEYDDCMDVYTYLLTHPNPVLDKDESDGEA